MDPRPRQTRQRERRYRWHSGSWDPATRAQIACLLVGADVQVPGAEVPPSRDWFVDLPTGRTMAADIGQAAGNDAEHASPSVAMRRHHMALFRSRRLASLRATEPGSTRFWPRSAAGADRCGGAPHDPDYVGQPG